MGLRDRLLYWSWNNTCGHKAPFSLVKYDVNQEGRRSLLWECRQCRKERKEEKAQLACFERFDSRPTNIEEPGSNEQEAQQAQQTTRFQCQHLHREPLPVIEVDPVLIDITPYDLEQRLFRVRGVVEDDAQRQATEQERADEEEQVRLIRRARNWELANAAEEEEEEEVRRTRRQRTDSKGENSSRS